MTKFSLFGLREQLQTYDQMINGFSEEINHPLGIPMHDSLGCLGITAFAP